MLRPRNRVYRRLYELEERDDDQDGIPDVYQRATTQDGGRRAVCRVGPMTDRPAPGHPSARRPDEPDDRHARRRRQPRHLDPDLARRSQLAKSELKVSVKAGGLGIGLFAAAAFIAVLGVIMLSVAIAYFIHWNGAGSACTGPS